MLNKKQLYTYVCNAISISNVNIIPVLTWKMYNTILMVVQLVLRKWRFPRHDPNRRFPSLSVWRLNQVQEISEANKKQLSLFRGQTILIMMITMCDNCRFVNELLFYLLVFFVTLLVFLYVPSSNISVILFTIYNLFSLHSLFFCCIRIQSKHQNIWM